MKIDSFGKYSGQKPYMIHNNELVATLERRGEFYLTYEQYQKVKDLSDAIKKKCDNLDNQKKLEIQRLKLVIAKIKNS